MSKFNLKLKDAVVTTALMAIGGIAHAAPTYCNAGPHADGISVSDVNYSSTGVAPFSNASNCYGVVIGNINPTNNAEDGIFGATAFQYADANNEASGTANLFGGNFTFTITGPANGATTAKYTLSATDNNGATTPNYPFLLDFVIALKASDRYALYFFDNVVFDGSGGGSWSIEYVNNGGQIPGLSHLAVFVREGSGGIPPTVTVPEPTSLALLGLGLLAFG